MSAAPTTPSTPCGSTPPASARRPSPRPSPWRRAAWTLGAVAAVVATAAGCSATSPPPPAASPSPGAHGKHRASGVRGTVQAENGTTWTVSTKAGKQITVTLAPTTAFGTKAAPATAAQFPVGAPVRVRGTVTGTTVAATRITAPKPAPA